MLAQELRETERGEARGEERRERGDGERQEGKEKGKGGEERRYLHVISAGQQRRNCPPSVPGVKVSTKNRGKRDNRGREERIEREREMRERNPTYCMRTGL